MLCDVERTYRPDIFDIRECFEGTSCGDGV